MKISFWGIRYALLFKFLAYLSIHLLGKDVHTSMQKVYICVCLFMHVDIYFYVHMCLCMHVEYVCSNSCFTCMHVSASI